MKIRMRILALGNYPMKEMPQALRDALAFEVQRHMEGYGCESVAVCVTQESPE